MTLLHQEQDQDGTKPAEVCKQIKTT